MSTERRSAFSRAARLVNPAPDATVSHYSLQLALAELERARATVAEFRTLLQSMNHMGGDPRGGYCICIKNDGSVADRWHASHCVDARALLGRLDAESKP